jgi:ribonucleoside-diphosphate reductase alpha chain
MPRIKRITKLDEKQLTVDVEVAETHSYQLGNGWVSHNTVSQLVDCSSGIHARFAPMFIRRVRCDRKDPMANLMTAAGFPVENDVFKPDHQVVFSFPMKVPASAITADNMTAIEQLELWHVYQSHWCEHKPSMTVYVREHEWMEVGAWVYRHFDEISGIAFLPYSGHVYKQAPYEECSQAEYDEMMKKMPKTVDWGQLCKFESDDTSINHKEYGCVGDKCELTDAGS